MLKDVTDGRYTTEEGRLHTLDARVKLSALLVYVVSLFFLSSPVSLSFSALALILSALYGRVDIRKIFRFLGRMFITVSLSFLLFSLLVRADMASVVAAIFRMAAVVVASGIFSAVTRPRDTADAVSRALFFLSPLGVPVNDISTVIALTFRFIPILSEEAERIMDAQYSRGGGMGKGSLRRRAASLMPFVIPLFASAFRRADELADAMDSRYYFLREEGKRDGAPYSRKDRMAYLVILLYVVALIMMKVAGL